MSFIHYLFLGHFEHDGEKIQSSAIFLRFWAAPHFR
jgi:hypothetical protein